MPTDIAASPVSRRRARWWAQLGLLVGWLVCSHQLLAPKRVAARDSSADGVYARVLVDSSAILAGPDASYRRIMSARRDALFPVRARAAQGYWLEVELPDGTTGFIRGDTVYVSTVSDKEANAGRFLPMLFAPPPLLEAHGEVALVGGVLGGGGLIALRPSWLLSSNFGIEATAAAAVAPGGRLLIAMLGPFVNLFPEAPVVPFLNVAGGVIASSPNADTFLLQSSSLVGMSAGAGLRIGFRYRITLRLEARSYVFFETDRYVREEELSAGLSVFL